MIQRYSHCDSFRWTAKGLSHTYRCIHSPLNSPPPSRLPHDIDQSSMCYTVCPHRVPPNCTPPPPNSGDEAGKRRWNDPSITRLVQRRVNTVNCLYVRLQSLERPAANLALGWHLGTGIWGVFPQISRTDKNDSLCLNCLHKQYSLFWTPAFILGVWNLDMSGRGYLCDPSFKNLVLNLKIWISSVQSLSHVQLFVTPWITARQASLSIKNLDTKSLKASRVDNISHMLPQLITGEWRMSSPPGEASAWFPPHLTPCAFSLDSLCIFHRNES